MWIIGMSVVSGASRYGTTLFSTDAMGRARLGTVPHMFYEPWSVSGPGVVRQVAVSSLCLLLPLRVHRYLPRVASGIRQVRGNQR